MTCTCWSPSSHPQPDCPRGRAEAAERARADRLIDEARNPNRNRVSPITLRDELGGWTEAEKRAAWGDR